MKMFTRPFVYILIVLTLVGLACGVTAQPPKNEAAGQADGERIFNNSGCSGCHNGQAGLAPSLHGIYGEEVTLESGETLTVDESYLQESILEPGAQVVRGYDPIMPEYGEQLSEGEVEALIEYIRSLD
jgi:cytochrome c oxidase subunit 2